MSALPQTVTWFVPGRVELLGKHTDYAGGRSLLAAVDRGHTVAARAREDRLLRVTSAIARETIEIDLDAPEPAERMGAGHWSGYVRTVVDRLRANFPGHSRGADIQVESDLPLAAGMSSSSALVVGLALAFGELCGMQDAPAFREVVTDRERLAEYLGCVENGQSYGSLAGHRGVGTFGGSEDHVAMLCGRADEMVQYAFCPVRSEASVPFPEDRAIVMAVSGVQAEKTGSALERYNRVSLSARDIVGIWNERTGRRDATLGDIVTGSSGAADELRGMIDPGTYLMGRLVQFLEESERIIPAASDALATGDLATFGSLVDESQQLAEEGLGNQTPETVALQRLARELGADAASAFGAGFGGSVWAMVPAAHADSFAVEWLDRYADAFPVPGRAATWLVTRPGPPAHRVEG
ncbi:galactokinase [Brachybacterium endophyticum]|uniref:galactokinase n=1 Tax=Brachybacterium endophyticum TaxID=2182385 RepID=UPI001F0C60F2|nr:galactokinase family protein [Brachybacterium endophyticum]